MTPRTIFISRRIPLYPLYDTAHFLCFETAAAAAYTGKYKRGGFVAIARPDLIVISKFAQKAK